MRWLWVISPEKHMAFFSSRDQAQTRFLLVVVVLFVSYICVALPLPVVPVFVSHQLGMNNVLAGLAVGSAFFSTIFTRGIGGKFADRKGAKRAVLRGLGFYAAGALISLVAGLFPSLPWIAYVILIVGRLLIGLGESLVGIGVVTWGIGIMGPSRSGQVIAFVGAALYGALAVGGPAGVALFNSFGFSGTMAVSIILPLLGMLAIWPIAGVAPQPDAQRPSFLTVMSEIWKHGLVVCLQGIGFAALSAFFVLYFLQQGWSHPGLGFTAFGGGFVLMRFLFGHLPDKLGGVRVAMGSLAVEAVGQFLIWAAPTPSLALLGAFLTGIGCSMVFPAMGREVVHLVKPHLRGTALGGYAASQDIAYGLTGPLAGFLADRAGYASVFAVGGIAAVLGLLLAWSLKSARS